MTYAVVPACGLSTRMGRPKLALPVGNRTVIELVVTSLRGGGVERVVVVVGPHGSGLIPLAAAAGAAILSLPEGTPDMRATVERGLAWIEDHHHPDMNDCWLLAPADHPAFSASVVRQLLDCAAACDVSVAIPAFNGQRGHPALLRWRHAASIRDLDAGLGINSFFRNHADRVTAVAVTDPGILANLDTPEDYERLCEFHRR